MKWHLYKKDDPNTWPKIDCPMVIAMKNTVRISTYGWDNENHCFYERCSGTNRLSKNDCFYAYIGHIPSGYKTCHPIICTCDNCPEGYDDNGYCMDYDGDYTCEYKKEVAEYSIEEKRIWKEFE